MNTYDTANPKAELNGAGWIIWAQTEVKAGSDGTCPDCGAPAGSNCRCWEE